MHERDRNADSAPPRERGGALSADVLLDDEGGLVQADVGGDDPLARPIWASERSFHSPGAAKKRNSPSGLVTTSAVNSSVESSSRT